MINNLPSEIIIEIAKWIDGSEHMTTLNKVCKYWNEILDPDYCISSYYLDTSSKCETKMIMIARNLDIKKIKFTCIRDILLDDYCLLLISYMKNIEEIIFPYYGHYTSNGIGLLKRCYKLKKIEFKYLDEHKNINWIIHHISKLKSLEELILNPAYITDHLIYKISKIHNLKKLDLVIQGNIEFTSGGFCILSSMRNLEKVKIKYVSYNNDLMLMNHAELLAKYFTSMKNLTELTLIEFYLTDVSLRYIRYIYLKYKKLKKINLSSSYFDNLTINGIKYLVSIQNYLDISPVEYILKSKFVNIYNNGFFIGSKKSEDTQIVIVNNKLSDEELESFKNMEIIIFNNCDNDYITNDANVEKIKSHGNLKYIVIQECENTKYKGIFRL